MSFLGKVERKLGRYAIKNLTLYILVGYGIGYLLNIMMPQVYGYLIMNPYLVTQGQVWRLFTWVITIPQELDIFIIFMFTFFYWIGTSLERIWGTFRYNMYIFSGIIFMTVGAMVTYFILKAIDPVYAAMIPISISTYYINMTSFLAFALCIPDVQVLFMLVFPIKVKWLAIVDLVLIGLDFISIGNQVDAVLEKSGFAAIAGIETYRNMFVWSQRALMIVPLLNFFIFFLCTRNYKRVSPSEIRRKHVYNKEINEAKATRMIAKHRCAVCGRTDKDNEDLAFRFCSKCNGNYEYCQDHIFDHVHVE